MKKDKYFYLKNDKLVVNEIRNIDFSKYLVIQKVQRLKEV